MNKLELALSILSGRFFDDYIAPETENFIYEADALNYYASHVDMTTLKKAAELYILIEINSLNSRINELVNGD